MRTAIACRGGVAAATFAAASALMLGLSGPASAAVLYQNDHAKVRVIGEGVTALLACLTDAQDGVIQTVQLVCEQVMSHGPQNALVFEGVDVVVTPARQDGWPLYENVNAKVTVSGQVPAAVKECIDEALYGHIDPPLLQAFGCKQFAGTGNLVVFNDVAVLVEQ